MEVDCRKWSFTAGDAGSLQGEKAPCRSLCCTCSSLHIANMRTTAEARSSMDYVFSVQSG